MILHNKTYKLLIESGLCLVYKNKTLHALEQESAHLKTCVARRTRKTGERQIAAFLRFFLFVPSNTLSLYQIPAQERFFLLFHLPSQKTRRGLDQLAFHFSHPRFFVIPQKEHRADHIPFADDRAHGFRFPLL